MHTLMFNSNFADHVHTGVTDYLSQIFAYRCGD